MIGFEHLSSPLASTSEAPGDRRILGSIICEKTASACARNYPGLLRALILTGSLARNEATWAPRSEGWELLGDAEFLLVLEPRAPLPPQAALKSMEGEIQAELRRERIAAHVQLAPVYPRFFEELQPRIFAYELRACGRVVLGDASVVQLIPELLAADIMLEDAWRLLANRMIENLEAASEVEGSDGAAPPEMLRYRTIKLYLDMATSLSVFAGFYSPTYRERCRRLSVLAGAPEEERDWPFPLQPFSKHVNAATDLKLRGDSQATGFDREFGREAVRYAGLLWQWELAHLTGAKEPASSQDLMLRWMRRQPMMGRLRGWMFVWRACGWLRGGRQCLRWARLMSKGSPRYCVYQAAHTLFEQLSRVLESGAKADITPEGSEHLVNDLPVLRTARRRDGWSWGNLVREVAWNYHQFLEPTRA